MASTVGETPGFDTAKYSKSARNATNDTSLGLDASGTIPALSKMSGTSTRQVALGTTFDIG